MNEAVFGIAALACYLAFWIFVNGVFALVVRRFPKSWFDLSRALYRPRFGEAKLYWKLGINRWKGRLPECGWMTGYSKAHVALTGNAQQDPSS